MQWKDFNKYVNILDVLKTIFNGYKMYRESKKKANLIYSLKDISIHDFFKLLEEKSMLYLLKDKNRYKYTQFELDEAYYSIMEEYHLKFKDEYQIFRMEQEMLYAKQLVQTIQTEDSLIIKRRDIPFDNF
jgi:hypothetical protein